MRHAILVVVLVATIPMVPVGVIAMAAGRSGKIRGGKDSGRAAPPERGATFSSTDTMRNGSIIGSGFAGAMTLISPAIAAAAPALPSFSSAYLTAASFVVTLGALAGLIISNRALRRELDRRGVEHEREHSTRLQAEQKLRLVREELERETQSKRDELGGVQRQLDLARAQLEAAEGRLNRLARIDDVTGLANRRRFVETLDQEIKRTIRDKASLSLVLCEIDFYEEYARRRDDGRNDETLHKVAQAVEEVFRRAGDLVARYGTSKIAIILPSTDAEASARFGEPTPFLTDGSGGNSKSRGSTAASPQVK